MSGLPVAPLALPGIPDAATDRRAAIARRHSMPTLPRRQMSSAVLELAAVDQWGRVVAHASMTALGWFAADHIDFREKNGLILVTKHPGGACVLTKDGQLRLPVWVRRWCGLDGGSRVLVVAEPAAQRMVLHPIAVLDALVAQCHAAILGGDV